MVLKKDILTDMKKYNKELEKHIPGLDFDSLKNNPNLTEDSSANDEYLTLLASGVSDIRVEMSLLRKNIMADVEGLVLRSIAAQQNSFLEQTNKFQTQMISDLKNNFSTYISEMSNELVNLKSEFNKMSAKNIELDSKLSLFNNNVLEFKSLVEKFDLDLKTHSLNPINNKLIEIEDKFSDFNSSSKLLSDAVLGMNSKVDNVIDNINLMTISQVDFDSKISNNLNKIEAGDSQVSSNVSNLNLKINSLTENLSNIENENSNLSKNFKSKINNLNKKISSSDKIIEDEIISNVENKLKNIEEKLNQNSIQKPKNVKKNNLDIEILNQVKSSSLEKNFKNRLTKNSKFNQIVDIESKLSKLNSLR